MRVISIGAALAATIFAAVAATGCAKNDNYAADTAAASLQSADTVGVSSTTTTTVTTGTTNKTTASKPAAKKTTTQKKTPPTPTY